MTDNEKNKNSTKTKGGVGLIGMNRNTGIIRSQMPSHALKASAKRAAKKSFNSDRATASFKKRAAEFNRNKISLEREQDFDKEGVKNLTNQKSINNQKLHAAKKLNISLIELDRRLELIKKGSVS
ncbi:hypothetical protein N8390_05290 [Amylibacter sp.]|nr:hypothetical protein [Amylibacter sp.]